MTRAEALRIAARHVTLVGSRQGGYFLITPWDDSDLDGPRTEGAAGNAYHCIASAARQPVSPAPSTSHGKTVGRIPMARSRPWTGKGL